MEFFIILENLLLKIEPSEITSFFYNNFFGFGGGGGFPLSPLATPLVTMQNTGRDGREGIDEDGPRESCTNMLEKGSWFGVFAIRWSAADE